MTLPWSDPSQTLDEGEKWLIERQWFTIRLLWGSLLAALAGYVIIANVIGAEGAVGIEPQPGDPAWLAHAPRYVLGIMSPGVLIAACVIRRAAGNPRSRIRRLMGTYLAMIVVTSALCESVGIFGLIVFLMEGDFLWLYVFVGTAAAAQILLRPRKEDLVNLAVHSKSKKDS
jgi:hypothetical protein